MKPELQLERTYMPKQQIICFIDPQKFSKLLGPSKSKKLGFYRNDSFLNNSKHLVYVDDKGKSSIGSYVVTKASSAFIILVPDRFDFTYEPKCEFTVLFHGLTVQERVNRLEKLPNFRGSKKSMEDSSTVYSEIASYLKEEEESGADFKRTDVNLVAFDSIWQKLTNEFLKGKIDNFCTKILMQHELDSIDLPDCLSQFTKEFNEFKEIVGTSYDSNNTEHDRAFKRLQGKFLRSQHFANI